MSGSTHAQCERCWIDANAEFDMAVFPDGTVGERIVSIRLPVVTLERKVERCGWCGAPTIAGIFVRADPSSVPYPAKEMS